MFVGDHPAAVRTTQADGLAHPDRQLDPALVLARIQVKHIGECDIVVRDDGQVVRFQADRALIAVEPAQEVAAHFVGSREPQRCDGVVVDDVGRIERHQPIDVLRPLRRCPALQ
ncbi:hypothetical protein IU502_00455 [Nocardia cyriacigeorgica]|nr:hypothetical protein [Nocardia cyriacigeorgica]